VIVHCSGIENEDEKGEAGVATITLSNT